MIPAEIRIAALPFEIEKWLITFQQWLCGLIGHPDSFLDFDSVCRCTRCKKNLDGNGVPQGELNRKVSRRLTTPQEPNDGR